MSSEIGEPCVCGHVKFSHIDNLTKYPTACFWRSPAGGRLCQCMEFKLDNLKWIKLVGEKNLKDELLKQMQADVL